MKAKLSIVVCLFSLMSFRLSAQHERLILPDYNLRLKIHQLGIATSKTALVADTIDLPFIDDFSFSDVLPATELWTDQLVFINHDFGRNMPTLGMATFDGMNGFGEPYDPTVATSTGPCDTLTSRYIRTLTKPVSAGGGQYSLADSLTLFFFYQLKGWGDAPEAADSLVVEFYNSSGNWNRVWFVKGPPSSGSDTLFLKAEIRIRDAQYLHDAFRFRFRNWGARTGSLDHFHIDYVRFFKAFNSFTGQMDTVLSDVAYTRPAGSLLVDHTSVPWDHFKSLSQTDRDNLVLDSLTAYYRINDPLPQDVGFNNRIYNYLGNLIAGFGQTNGNIFPQRPNNQNLTYTLPVDSVFPLSPEIDPDTNFFEVKTFFSNGNAYGGLKSNDTLRYYQRFENFYSYDDGTAEAGYDLVNSPNGKLAQQFTILKPDTLRAVRMHFVRQNADVSTKLFTLKIWSSLNPETLIYQEINQRPVYIDSLGAFATYVLDQIVPVSGTIYVGFQQVSPDGLHLGFDRNTVSNSRMFFNVNGSWNQVNVAPGSFMIRPVMGDTSLFVSIDENSPELDFVVYPVPVVDYLSVSFPDNTLPRYYRILSPDGRLISGDIYSGPIAVDALKPGVYMLQLEWEKGLQKTRRFVKL